MLKTLHFLVEELEQHNYPIIIVIIRSKTYPQKKRTRISKACEYCRKKKVKCNGCQPCLNCLQSNNGDCEYAVNDEKKPKILKRRNQHL